jgi:hypothetical protein
MAKWATKNPPNKKGRYLVTIKSSFGRQVRQADRAEYPKGNWMWCVLPDCSTGNDIIAWQKCPEPFIEDNCQVINR